MVGDYALLSSVNEEMYYWPGDRFYYLCGLSIMFVI